MLLKIARNKYNAFNVANKLGEKCCGQPLFNPLQDSPLVQNVFVCLIHFSYWKREGNEGEH